MRGWGEGIGAQCGRQRSIAIASLIGAFCGISVFMPNPALAHAADRGHVLLLPTGYYLIGGALAVALTFAVLVLVPALPLLTIFQLRLRLPAVPTWPRVALSALSLFVLGLLLAAGVIGSRDPLSNPLPLMVWTVFWVGLTLVHALAGNLWWWIEPWYAPWKLLRIAAGARIGRMRLPRQASRWPAVAQFAGFAWFELVYPAPDDPARLAGVVGSYFLLNLAAVLAFGHDAWMRQGECFTVFLRMVARLGIIEGGAPQAGRRSLSLCLPGAKLVDAPPLSASGTVFLLAALGSVSFDGLMRTFFWLGLIGVNPLEFPGRSAVMGSGTVSLLVVPTILAAAFFGAVALGNRLSAGPVPSLPVVGRLAWSIIPISIAYHASHYLTAFVVNGQYALAALSDPLMTGADLFGTAGLHVQAGTFLGADGAWALWNAQAGLIVGGHLMAVLVAHAVALDIHRSERRASLSQLPLAVLMVAYTVFGLWLLSAPTGA